MYFSDELPNMANCISKAGTYGYEAKILVSNDYCVHSDFAPRNQNGFHLSISEQVQGIGYAFDYLYDEFLKSEGKPEQWEKIISQNAMDVLDLD